MFSSVTGVFTEQISKKWPWFERTQASHCHSFLEQLGHSALNIEQRQVWKTAHWRCSLPRKCLHSAHQVPGLWHTKEINRSQSWMGWGGGGTRPGHLRDTVKSTGFDRWLVRNHFIGSLQDSRRAILQESLRRIFTQRGQSRAWKIPSSFDNISIVRSALGVKHVTISLHGCGNLRPPNKVSMGDQRWSICTASRVSLHALDTGGHTMRQSFQKPVPPHPPHPPSSTPPLITTATCGWHTHTQINPEKHTHTFSCE